MTNSKQILGSNCGNYPNALHVNLHSRLQSLISKAPLDKLRISQLLMDDYKKNIDDEIELNLESHASVETSVIGQVDQLRDADIDYFFGHINIGKLSPNKSERDAANALGVATSPYKNIKSESSKAETTHITGLLTDMDKPENAVHVTTLGLKTVLDDLKKYNEQFIALTATRSEGKAANIRDDSRKVRTRTDADFNDISNLIYTSQFTTTNAEDLAMISTLIDNINTIITEVKSSWKSSLTSIRAARRVEDEAAAKELGLSYEEYMQKKKDGTLPKTTRKSSKSRSPRERPTDLLEDTDTDPDPKPGDVG